MNSIWLAGSALTDVSITIVLLSLMYPLQRGFQGSKILFKQLAIRAVRARCSVDLGSSRWQIASGFLTSTNAIVAVALYRTLSDRTSLHAACVYIITQL
jgi:hypothetical protein